MADLDWTAKVYEPDPEDAPDGGELAELAAAAGRGPVSGRGGCDPWQLDRCDGSASGSEAGAVSWLRLADDAGLRLCVHHSEVRAAGLLAAGFRPLPDEGVELRKGFVL